jgi:hypothetical protein
VLNPGDPDLDVVADHHAFPLASAEYQHARITWGKRPADRPGRVRLSKTLRRKE